MAYLLCCPKLSMLVSFSLQSLRLRPYQYSSTFLTPFQTLRPSRELYANVIDLYPGRSGTLDYHIACLSQFSACAWENGRSTLPYQYTGELFVFRTKRFWKLKNTKGVWGAQVVSINVITRVTLTSCAKLYQTYRVVWPLDRALLIKLILSTR